ncbi:MAG TPA: helix-turn-helix domain-containing protein [Pseudonocardiaceae bacterium]|jgi:hypothetical protein|nr:helix-turn-helix domain-containing protein [Pseudonocardiaceae bacterium]
MQELVGRLAELDPDAGAAVKVIAYFDRLVEGRAGLEPIVRGAAVLAGCPARLVDDERRVQIRVDVAGRVQGGIGLPDPNWLSAPLRPGGPPVLWLERSGPAGPVEAMVLERAASAARGVLERTRGRAVAASMDDPASVEVLLDGATAAQLRLRAARQLGLAEDATVRAVALAERPARIESVDGANWPAHDAGADERAGIGPMGGVLDLPASYAAARTALRFTAAGTESDPGPGIVHADQLGGLAVLAGVIGPDTEPIADVDAVQRARGEAPWVLATLVAVATSPSLRTAAVALLVHHSTLQERLGNVEHLLGWSIRDPQGRLRLQLALAMWRLHQQP